MDQAPSCYRHPTRTTRITCQRCARPICQQCMISGAVGFHCPHCVQQGRRETRRARFSHGGTRSATPRVTAIVLIGLNVAVFLLGLLTGGVRGPVLRFLALTPLGLCPAGPDHYYPVDPDRCARFGQTWEPGVATGAFWQVLTSAFTHAQPLHLVLNMLVVFMLAPQVEGLLGRTRLLVIYLTSALWASVAVMVLSDPLSVTLGASGAVYGLLGALLLLAIKHKGDVSSILLWIGFNIAISVVWSDVISWEGHFGGLFGGLVTGALLLSQTRGSTTKIPRLPLVAAFAAIGVVLIVMQSMKLLNAF